MQCPVCFGSTEHFDCSLVLGRYEALFRRCLSCGFMFAEKPVWLEEAYNKAITATDLGLAGRNIWFSKVAASIVSCQFDADGRFLDYGGGTGLFTRLMRDAGFDWYCYDRSCPNIFAEGFSADIDNSVQYELLTAVELFEHLTDPVQAISELSKLSDNILFTTWLLPEPNPRLDAWWYYGLEHGQHVSFYSRKSLQVMAESAGFYLASNGENLHCFSKRKVSGLSFRLAASPFIRELVLLLSRRRSLLSTDFEKVRRSRKATDAYSP